jgi:hypothetical protein
MPGSGAVEFGQKNTLPGPEAQPPLLDQNLLTRTDKGRFDMRIAVAFGMSVIPSVGNKPPENLDHVPGHIGIATLIDGHCAGCVGGIKCQYAARAPVGMKIILNLQGDILEDFPLLCSDGYSVHEYISLVASGY